MDNNPPEVTRLADALMSPDEDDYTSLVAQLNDCCMSKESDGGRHWVITADCGAGPEEMPAGRALTSMVLLYSYRVAGVRPGPERFVRSQLDSTGLDAHLNETVLELYDVVEPEALNLAIATSMSYLMDAATSMTGRVGTSVSVLGLFDASRRDPRVKELLNWSSPSGELGEMERVADEAGAELISRLQAMPGEYGRLIRSGSAVNKDQVRQALVNIGVKPGLMDGELISEPINTSFLNGMRGVEDYYVCAIGARKALTTNYKQVKTSGYLSRKLVLLAANHFIDPELEECGTFHSLVVKVQSDEHADRLFGRMVSTEAQNEWHYAAPGEMKKAVGQQIGLRSPMTCAGQNGICHACYGKLARSNSVIHAGIYGMLVISAQIIARLLGSKHLLKARPTKIHWPDGFQDHFSVERASIIAESTVDRIYVKVDDVEIDEDEERQATCVFYYKVAGKNGRTKIITPVPVYLDREAWDSAESDDGEYVITPLQESAIFHVPVTNTDLSEALHAIFNLIEREELTDYNEAYDKLLLLLMKSDLKTPSIHAEIILRAMLRSSEDHMARPDFSVPESPGYSILKLTPAILNSPSVTNSLAFERVKAQLTSTEILRKFGPGVIDALFGG